MKQNTIEILDLGIIPYQQAYARQKQYVETAIEEGRSFLLLCEHPPVLTLGRLAKEEYVLYSKAELSRQGVELVSIDRGGEVTLHSPGQLVVYPILNLQNFGKDLKQYLSRLEKVGIDLLSEFDILAHRNSGFTGVWTGPQKIISIGIGVRKWVSFHGLGINVNTDLSLFRLIKPCGLEVSMTSMAQVKNSTIAMDLVKNKLSDVFCREFGLTKAQGHKKQEKTNANYSA